MGTVCCAPEVPVFDRPINPYLGMEGSRDMRIIETVNALPKLKLGETLGNTTTVVKREVDIYTPNQVVVETTKITTTPPLVSGGTDPASIFKQLQASPEAAIHGPPLDLAVPCELPPVSQAISERRKHISMG